MRVSVERLRVWLLVGAALLVLVVTGFLGYARYRARHFLTELPAKLGIDVRQETNGFTYSQTLKGRTVFTLHAAKAIQHNDGKYTLHDVGIAVYGHGDGQGSDRVDRIYGKEFDLDQATGVVKANGEVHLDLQAPAAKDASGKMDYAAGKDLKSSNDETMHEVGRGDARLIHVKTSGLVYLKELGVAATDQDIEFEYNGLTGHAKGADYNADSGSLSLQSAVKVSGLQKGKPLLLTASRAEMDRVNRKAVLSQAKYVTVSGEGDGGNTRQTVEARHAVVTMRPDNGVERLDGEGDVTVTAGNGLRMVADRGEVLLSADGKPKSAHMMGHVIYTADDATKDAKGSSSEARVAFDAKGLAEKVTLTGDVHMNEHLQPVDVSKSTGSDRELNAEMAEVQLVPNAQGRPQPREVKATGNARLKVVDTEKGKATRSSAMAADVLTANFVPANNGGERLDEVKGSGRTMLERVNEKGVVETSSADTLQVRFRSNSQKAATSGFEGSDIANALQRGHLVVTRKSPPVKGDITAPEMDHATAESASYDGGTQVLTLSGSVQLTNTDGMLWADRVAVEQKTGDASAEGSVKASYRQGSGSPVVHVLAQSAELKKANDIAVFHGNATRPARLWQGGSQVEAPVLEFNQKQRRLVARGDGAGAAMAVHTVLVSTGTGAAKPASANSSAAKENAVLRGSSVVRVASREMVYSDESRTADFTGGVRVESADGVMHGDRATAYLQASASQKQGAAGSVGLGKTDSGAGFLGGDLERVVVNGGIEIDQPGRRATGDKLVYTAGDGLFVLTGTPTSPSRVVDQARGAVTGVELRFHSEDESVVISNGDKGGSGLRVHTETRVKRDR
jgi:lipopolysaccharide export system protein LptA